MPIQDKIHKYFPGKTWLTTYNIHKFSPSHRHFLFHHTLRSTQIQPSETRLPTSPQKNNPQIQDSYYKRCFESSGISQKLIKTKDLIV